MKRHIFIKLALVIGVLSIENGCKTSSNKSPANRGSAFQSGAGLKAASDRYLKMVKGREDTIPLVDHVAQTFSALDPSRKQVLALLKDARVVDSKRQMEEAYIAAMGNYAAAKILADIAAPAPETEAKASLTSGLESWQSGIVAAGTIGTVAAVSGIVLSRIPASQVPEYSHQELATSAQADIQKSLTSSSTPEPGISADGSLPKAAPPKTAPSTIAEMALPKGVEPELAKIIAPEMPIDLLTDPHLGAGHAMVDSFYVLDQTARMVGRGTLQVAGIVGQAIEAVGAVENAVVDGAASAVSKASVKLTNLAFPIYVAPPLSLGALPRENAQALIDEVFAQHQERARITEKAYAQLKLENVLWWLDRFELEFVQKADFKARMDTIFANYQPNSADPTFNRRAIELLAEHPPFTKTEVLLEPWKLAAKASHYSPFRTEVANYFLDQIATRLSDTQLIAIVDSATPENLEFIGREPQMANVVDAMISLHSRDKTIPNNAKFLVEELRKALKPFEKTVPFFSRYNFNAIKQSIAAKGTMWDKLAALGKIEITPDLEVFNTRKGITTKPGAPAIPAKPGEPGLPAVEPGLMSDAARTNLRLKFEHYVKYQIIRAANFGEAINNIYKELPDYFDAKTETPAFGMLAHTDLDKQVREIFPQVKKAHRELSKLKSWDDFVTFETQQKNQIVIEKIERQRRLIERGLQVRTATTSDPEAKRTMTIEAELKALGRRLRLASESETLAITKSYLNALQAELGE